MGGGKEKKRIANDREITVSPDAFSQPTPVSRCLPPFSPCFTKGTTHALPISVISVHSERRTISLIKRKSDKLHLSARLLCRIYPRWRGKATSAKQRPEADI